MSRDFYTRDILPNTTLLLEVSDEISLLIEQIECILFTKTKSVIGNSNFGVDLEDLLFTLNANEGQIKSKITSQINSYCPLASKYSVEIDVNFIKDVDRDIGIIDIYIDARKTLTVLL